MCIYNFLNKYNSDLMNSLSFESKPPSLGTYHFFFDAFSSIANCQPTVWIYQVLPVTGWLLKHIMVNLGEITTKKQIYHNKPLHHSCILLFSIILTAQLKLIFVSISVILVSKTKVVLVESDKIWYVAILDLWV